MKLDFAYKLKTPIQFHCEGKSTEGKVIILTAPSNKQRRPAARLKQFFFKAIASLPPTDEATQAKAAAAKKSKTKGSDLVMILNMSDVDCDEVHDAFKQLMTDGCAAVDGKEQVTDNIYESFQFADTEEMLGDYLVNFLIPSF